MVEFYANNANDPGDYLIGEQFDLKKHVGLRRMDNPASDGSSLNCWSSNAKNVDVHYCSGIGNHFFYLLAEGSGAKTINGVAHNSPDLQRLDDHRHRPRRRAEDLVPGADRLHDLEHQLRRRPDRHAERRQGPLRRGQHPVHHGRRCMERGLRVLTSLPPPEVRSPQVGGPCWAHGPPTCSIHR